jgi:hypothetical protein
VRTLKQDDTYLMSILKFLLRACIWYTPSVGCLHHLALLSFDLAAVCGAPAGLPALLPSVPESKLQPPLESLRSQDRSTLLMLCRSH